jgi:prepilin-type N-terminal cleavage/methylation domain-containing protein
MPRPVRRSGFTLAEVLVAIGLIAVLAAVMVPTIKGRFDDSYENALIGEMSSLANAIGAYRQDVGKYPVSLDYLTALPAAATDRCGAALTALERAKWHGPYVTTSIPAGIGSFVFASKDTIALPLVAVSTGLAVQVFGPDTATAVSMDLKVDGQANKSAGSIVWSTVTAGRNTDAHVAWVVPYRSGAC